MEQNWMEGGSQTFWSKQLNRETHQENFMWKLRRDNDCILRKSVNVKIKDKKWSHSKDGRSMDFKACCFFGHRPRCPKLINLAIMTRMNINLNEDYKELLIPSTYESEVSGYSSQVWRRPNRTKPRIEVQRYLVLWQCGKGRCPGLYGQNGGNVCFHGFPLQQWKNCEWIRWSTTRPE